MYKRLQWTCAGNPALEGRRRINGGSFGSVYEIRSGLRLPLNHVYMVFKDQKGLFGKWVKGAKAKKVFARKLMQVTYPEVEETVENEAKVLDFLFHKRAGMRTSLKSSTM